MIKYCKIRKLNKRMDKLLDVMKQEKKVVDTSFGDWDKVALYLFKAKSTMKALRRLNKIIIEINK